MYTLRTMDETPMAIPPIFSINTKKTNQEPKENRRCSILGKATVSILRNSAGCRECMRNKP